MSPKNTPPAEPWDKPPIGEGESQGSDISSDDTPPANPCSQKTSWARSLDTSLGGSADSQRSSDASTDDGSQGGDVSDGDSHSSDDGSEVREAVTSARSVIGSEDKSSPKEPTPEQQKLAVHVRPDECARHSHDPGFDLRLATWLVELMGVEVVVSLPHALGERFCARPREVDRAVRLLLGTLRLLHLCGYPGEDIEVVVALAAAYGQRAGPRWGSYREQPEMGLTETVHATCMFIYVAHAYCEDETCALHVWHQHIFREYCTLRRMNALVVGLLEQLQFRLRVQDEELEERLAFLQKGREPEMPGRSDELPCSFRVAARGIRAFFPAIAWPSPSRGADESISCLRWALPFGGTGPLTSLSIPLPHKKGV